jgi:hypothetical protein
MKREWAGAAQLLRIVPRLAAGEKERNQARKKFHTSITHLDRSPFLVPVALRCGRCGASIPAGVT